MGKIKWKKAQERLWVHHNFKLLDKYSLQNKDKPYIMGADFSLTGTGLVAIDWTGKLIGSEDIGTEAEKSGLTLKERIYYSRNKFKEFLSEYPCSMFCYESVTVLKPNIIPLSMVLGQMFSILCEFEENTKLPTYSVAPSINGIKKAVTGKGGSDKSIILKDILFKWGENINSDNIGDAYGAARIGLAAVKIKDIYFKLLEETDKDLDKFLLDFSSARIPRQKEMLEESGVDMPMFEVVHNVFNDHQQMKENESGLYYKTTKIIKAY